MADQTGDTGEYSQGYWAGIKEERQRALVYLRSMGVDIEPLVCGEHWND